MGRFYTITAIIAGLILLIILLPVPESLGLPMLLLVIALYGALLVFGASRIDSNFFIRAHCRGNAADRKLAITFDDGPHGERSEEILRILRKHECKASFFLIGSRAEEYPEILKMMVEDGHLLGNHSYSHSKSFPLYNRARIHRELKKTNGILEAASSGPIRFFRPPFGVSNPRIAGGLKGSGMEVAGWSIRSFDTGNQAAEKVVNRILTKIEPGSVILLHESSEHILEILIKILPAIREAGYQCITLDQMFQTNAGSRSGS